MNFSRKKSTPQAIGQGACRVLSRYLIFRIHITLKNCGKNIFALIYINIFRILKDLIRAETAIAFQLKSLHDKLIQLLF